MDCVLFFFRIETVMAIVVYLVKTKYASKYKTSP